MEAGNYTQDQKALQQFGSLLFNALFKEGKVRQMLAICQTRVRDDPDLRLRLRIKLVINPVEPENEIAKIPWELLHDPEEGPMALYGTSIVRYFSQMKAQPPKKTKTRIKVL